MTQIEETAFTSGVPSHTPATPRASGWLAEGAVRSVRCHGPNIRLPV